MKVSQNALFYEFPKIPKQWWIWLSMPGDSCKIVHCGNFTRRPEDQCQNKSILTKIKVCDGSVYSNLNQQRLTVLAKILRGNDELTENSNKLSWLGLNLGIDKSKFRGQYLKALPKSPLNNNTTWLTIWRRKENQRITSIFQVTTFIAVKRAGLRSKWAGLRSRFLAKYT